MDSPVARTEPKDGQSESSNLRMIRDAFDVSVGQGFLAGLEALLERAREDCKRRNYQTQKSKRNHPDRIEFRKYCRWCGKHTPHKETR